MMLPGICLKVSLCSILKSKIIFSNTAFRYVRSIAKRQPVGAVQTLEGTVKTEYDSILEEDLSVASNLGDLKRLVRQVFVNTDETQTVEEYNVEEQYDAPIEHAKKFYEMDLKEEKAYKSRVKKYIVKKKYFKEPRETNLLTYAAKMQIRHLHQLDPIKWTPEMLAESFPISVNGVKKLLKNNYKINDVEKIKQHDKDVAEKWKLLESGDTQFISPITVQLYVEGKITRDHHAGNFNLPSLVIEEKIVDCKPKRIGEHAAMIKYFLDLKTNSDTKEVTVASKDACTDLTEAKNKVLEAEQKDIRKAILPEFQSRYPTRREMESMQSASYLAAEEPDPDEIEIPQSQFEKNLLQEFSEKPSKSRSSVDIAYDEWLEKQLSEKGESNSKKPRPFDPRDFFETVKKCSGDAIELNVDKDGIFIYDEHLGYQQPLGKEVIQRRIKIPKEKYVPGALYRVGKKFYADDGAFLFKVFV